MSWLPWIQPVFLPSENVLITAHTYFRWLPIRFIYVLITMDWPLFLPSNSSNLGVILLHLHYPKLLQIWVTTHCKEVLRKALRNMRLKLECLDYLNIPKNKYALVLMVRRGPAFKLLVDLHPFETNKNLSRIWVWVSIIKGSA